MYCEYNPGAFYCLVYLSFIQPFADIMCNYISCENSKEESNIIHCSIHLFLIKLTDDYGRKNIDFVWVSILISRFAYDIMPVGKKRYDDVPCEQRTNPRMYH